MIPALWLEPITQWHDDYQQILMDFLEETVGDENRMEIAVSIGDIRDHMDEWNENSSWWEP